ncbi:MAG: cytochrome c3 family protein [Planctomycetota bacterium]
MIRAAHLPFWVGSTLILGVASLLTLTEPSPAPLAEGHARIDGISTLGGCVRCHSKEGLSAGCLDCHREIQSQLTDRTGFHSFITQREGKPCEGCHSEHFGLEFEVGGPSAWLQTESEANTFDHPHIDDFLDGAHRRLTCQECHAAQFARPIQAAGATGPRTRSYLGLDQECVTCHEDPHAGGRVTDCEACHDQQTFRPARGFDHDLHFPLGCAHQTVPCASCHRVLAGSGQSPASVPFLEVTGKTCEECHPTPHHRILGACDDCHGATDCKWDDAIASISVETHATFGFALTPPHDAIACRDCHPPASSYDDRFLDPASDARRQSTDCLACHGDPHEAQFGRAPRCLDCHEPTRFVPSNITAKQHVTFPLSAAHADLACARCHDGSPRRFRDLPKECADCHTNPHGAQFDSEIRRGGCATCHDPAATAFAIRPFNHDERTNFGLDGAHAHVDCCECHTSPLNATPSDAAPPGTAPVRFRGTPARCADCHTDEHRGQFESGGACSDCHDTKSFVPALWGIDRHGRFPLVGAHEAVACASCHPRPAPDEPRRYVGAPRTCAACHENPHGHQFDSEIARDGCEVCHTASRFDFTIRPFDHELRTGYALRGEHARASCDQCHRIPASNPLGARQFRGTLSSCSSCHTDPHWGQFERDGTTSCETCHSSFERWSADRFSHTSTRLPLDGNHAELECSSCHPRATATNGKTTVLYRPIGHRCQDCHGKPSD